MTDTFWMAPLHGITYFPFRNTYLKYFQGVDAIIAPFIPAQEFEQHSLPSKIDLFAENNKTLPVVPQIMGTDANKIVDTVSYLSQSLGYSRFNWNIGCPMKNIVKKNRGCGMMRFPEQVEQVVEAALSKTTCQFSVKMRLGMENVEQGQEIIERLNKYPLEFVVIHPRFGTQQYEGVVNLQQFDHLYQQCQHPIIYSGDIGLYGAECDAREFYQQLKQRYPKITQWMVGRGMLWDPFVFSKLRNSNPNNTPIRHFFDFYDTLKNELLSHKNESTVLGIIKELWKYFARFLELEEMKLRSILRCQTIVEMGEIESFIKKTKIERF